MAVDLYVGTLTRYYTGQWENVVQKAAREQGLKYQVIRPTGDNSDAVTDPSEAEIAIQHWQQNVSNALKESGGTSGATWQEGMTPPYFTDRIGWDPLFALILWASYIEREAAPPSKISPDMMNDPKYHECLADPSKYQTPTILSAQLWLPVDFVFYAKFPSPAGQEVDVGSLEGITSALGKINELSWKKMDWRSWLKNDFEDRANLELNAQFGFAALASMAVEAKKNQLPMVLSF